MGRNLEQLKKDIGCGLDKILLTDQNAFGIKKLLQKVNLKRLLQLIEPSGHKLLFQKLKTAHFPAEVKGPKFSQATVNALCQIIDDSFHSDLPSSDTFCYDERICISHNQFATPSTIHSQMERDLPRSLNKMFFDGNSLLKLACKFIAEVKNRAKDESAYHTFFEKLKQQFEENGDQILQKLCNFAASEADFGRKEDPDWPMGVLGDLAGNICSMQDKKLLSQLLCFVFESQITKTRHAQKFTAQEIRFVNNLQNTFHQGIFSDVNQALTNAYNQTTASNNPLYCKFAITPQERTLHFSTTSEGLCVKITSSTHIPALVELHEKSTGYSLLDPTYSPQKRENAVCQLKTLLLFKWGQNQSMILQDLNGSTALAL